jgi:outer membrane protein TolC
MKKVMCFLVGILGSSAQATPLEFDAAWQQVLQKNQGLAAERSGITRAEQLAEAARALYLPQIDLKGSYTRLDKPVELDLMDLNPIASNKQNPLLNSAVVQQLIQGLGGASAFVTPLTEQDVITSSVQALWPIYAGGRIDAAQSIRQAQVDEANQQFALKQQAAFEALTQRYFGLVLARHVLKTRQRLEHSLSVHLQHARKLEQQGQIAAVERLSAESALAKAQVETLAAQRQTEIAELALGSLLQQSGPLEPQQPLFVQDQLPPAARFVQQTLDHHPGLKLLAAKQQQADGLITVEQGKRLPEWFLFGNYSLYEQDTLAAKMAPDWMVGVGVKVPLSSRDGLSDTVVAAATTQVQVKQLLAQLRQDLTLLVEQSWREADLAREQYQHLAVTEQLAQENIRLREKAFAQGLGTSLDAEDAQTKLAGVQTQRQVAAYQYVVCLARLLSLSGQATGLTEYQKNQRIEVVQ